MKYYDKSPKEGGKEISEWEYFESLNQAQNRFAINPIHNFDLLKEFRKKMFEVDKVKFIEERSSKNLVIGEFELNCFYVAWLNKELKVIESWLSDKHPNGEAKKTRFSTSDQIEILKYEAFIKSERDNAQTPKSRVMLRALKIPTKATPEEILIFWSKLKGNNEKGEPYWDSGQEINHFVNQNFEGFEGVTEIKEFAPNMNKTEFYQVAQIFMNKYKISKSKNQYADMLIKNFTKFKDDSLDNVKSNISDKGNKQLNKLFK